MNVRRRVAAAAVAAFVLIGTSGAAPLPDQPQDRRAANLRAFAKLYGYVRFFHPSDEAAELDWERFAVFGAARVKDAPSRAELHRRLEALVRPVAPAVLVFEDGATPPPPRHVPDDASGLEVVAWQHLGVKLDRGGTGTYRSLRTNRTVTVVRAGAGFGVLTQVVPADAYRGRRVRLRGAARVTGMGRREPAGFWLRVDRADGSMGFFDNMSDRPISSPDWRTYEIVGRVNDDATRVIFGALMSGVGELWVDDVELAAEDHGAWTTVPIADPGFEGDGSIVRRGYGEGSSMLPTLPDAWTAMSPAYRYELISPGAGSAQALRMRAETEVVAGPLFPATPRPGEFLDLSLGGGLSARLPVSLYADSLGTLPRADAVAAAALHRALADLDPEAGADVEDVRLAAVIVAWNVFQHFYPYFDDVAVNWEAELDSALARAQRDRTVAEFDRTLKRLVAALDDGHGRVIHAGVLARGRLPIALEWIENRAVVTASRDTGVRRGDVVLAVDGRPTRALVAEAEALISGSPQWKRYRAVSELGVAEPLTTARLRIDRDGRPLEVAVERIPRDQQIPEFDRPMIQRLDGDVWYVDLNRAQWAAIAAVIDSLAAAPAVIFDLRGYPAGNHLVLRHLLTGPDTSSAWMRIPRTIYPDHMRSAGYRHSAWRLQPAAPHIDGRVVFITDGRAISYAESVMGFVEHYGLGEIVGAPTAGANGNVNPFPVPGGATVMWTGMRVVKHDGRQHHLIGIQPTAPAARTIRGVRDGRDELLEIALNVARGRND